MGGKSPHVFFAKRGRAGKVGQRKFPRTLNLEGRAAAVPRTALTEIPSYVLPGTVHPKPAVPRSSGAAHNLKGNTFVRGPGGRAP